ncbi:MAG: hypothetical protein AAGB15_05970, partial [Pseudomonadota bacterium]
APEPAPEPMPEVRTDPEPEVVRAPEPQPEPLAAPAPQPEPMEARRSEEARYATAPSPSDIRARAEEVRQRALAARAARDNARQAQAAHMEEEPALFDLDDASVDRAPATQTSAEPEDQGGRGGLFTINKLIHRVAGSAGHDQAPRTEPREPVTPAIDEDGGDIPAFLRRQAN